MTDVFISYSRQNREQATVGSEFIATIPIHNEILKSSRR